jgi:DNA adenine methylase
LPYRPVFAGWRFRAGDVARVPLAPDDFVYADPPYDVPFTAYSRGGFSWHDQVRTAERLARHHGPVVLVNQATDRIVSLYSDCGFALQFLAAPRRISCTGDRAPAREVLATRNIEAAAGAL